MKVRVRKLSEHAVTPSYAKPGDAGLDLTAVEILNESNYQITYNIGLAIEIPEGYVGLIFPRSSIRNTNLSMSNAVGVIDSGYRGSIQATFNFHSNIYEKDVPYSIGDRIAQLIILPYPQIELIESEELSTTERNTGGFGSSGK